MNIRKLFTILATGVVSLTTIVCFAGERIWLDTKINGKPAKICFDSASNVDALGPDALQKFGLKFIPAPPNKLSRGIMPGDTEVCSVSLNGNNFRTSFVVLDVPDYARQDIDFDGLIGWCTLKQSVMQIDAVGRNVTLLPKVPRQVIQWNQFSVITNFGILEVEVPHSNGSNGIITIDTGNSCGMMLPPHKWEQWKKRHPRSPITLDTSYSPEGGFVVQEETWADQIHIGSLVLTDVPIMEEISSTAAATRWGAKHDGTLGLAGLSRLDVVVDGKNSIVYFRAKTTPPPVYSHNRLGAIFMPTTTHTNQAVAKVVTVSPAYEAGVRNGDVLLQVDEIPVIGWDANWRSRFYKPAGTKVNLILQRDGTNFTTTATLRQILEPSVDKDK